MPMGFLDPRVPKNQTLNFTIFALEDVLVKVGSELTLCVPSLAHPWDEVR